MSVMLLLSMIMILLSDAVSADTLLRNGRFKTIATDSSDMTFGGGFFENSAGNGCTYNTYYDRCNNVQGERVWVSDVGKDSYILSGDTITYCGRYRTVSNCIISNILGTTTTTSESYGGVTKTETLVGNDGASAINLGRSIDGACTSGCTDANGTIQKGLPEEVCTKIASNWFAINDDYKKQCANKQTCRKIQVLQACEGTKTSDLVGTYVPAPSDECTSSDVDQTRSIYMKEGEGSHNVYLYFGRSSWMFNSGFCSSIGIKTGRFDAGDEPFLDPEATVSCYNGGYTGNKRYRSTALELRCIDKDDGVNNGIFGGFTSNTSATPCRQNFGSSIALFIFAVAVVVHCLE